MIKLSLRKKLLLFIALPVAICTIVIVILSSIKINKQGIDDLINKSNAILGLNILEFTQHHYNGSTIVERNIENDLQGITSKISNNIFNYEFRIAAPDPLNDKHEPTNEELKYIEQFKNNNINKIIKLDKTNNKLLVVRPVYMMETKGCTDCHIVDNTATTTHDLKGIFLLKSDLNQVKHEVNASILQNSVAGFIIILISLLFAYLLSRSISKPIVELKNITEQLALGNINQQFESKSQDEIGAIAMAFNKLLLALKKIASFSTDIGDGNYSSNYKLLSDDDSIGKSLIRMRDNLKIAKQNEIDRSQKEEQESWVNQGIAKFSDILRKDTNNIGSLSQNFILNLVNYLNANQGALFIANEENKDNVVYELKACIAYERLKKANLSFKPGEGLVGQCAFEKLPIYLTEVPENYVKITSGLGQSNPRCVLLVPAILNNKTYAVIEIVSFTEFDDYIRNFIFDLGETLASTIANAKINEQTSNLLQETEKQQEELRNQEEEMRQNLEELQATQEEMKRKEMKLTKLNQELKQKLEDNGIEV